MTTIHVFGYGEAQIISEEVKFKCAVDKFKKLADVITDIKSKKPAAVKAGDFHTINIFDKRTDYVGKEKDCSFSTITGGLNKKSMDALTAEFFYLEKEAAKK